MRAKAMMVRFTLAFYFAEVSGFGLDFISPDAIEAAAGSQRLYRFDDDMKDEDVEELAAIAASIRSRAFGRSAYAHPASVNEAPQSPTSRDPGIWRVRVEVWLSSSVLPHTDLYAIERERT
jgi:hypothetical protein